MNEELSEKIKASLWVIATLLLAYTIEVILLFFHEMEHGLRFAISHSMTLVNTFICMTILVSAILIDIAIYRYIDKNRYCHYYRSEIKRHFRVLFWSLAVNVFLHVLLILREKGQLRSPFKNLNIPYAEGISNVELLTIFFVITCLYTLYVTMLIKYKFDQRITSLKS